MSQPINQMESQRLAPVLAGHGAADYLHDGSVMSQQTPILLPELSVSGRVLKIARLRHEWFEYLEDPSGTVDALFQTAPVADVVTFLQEAHYTRPSLSYYKEAATASVLKFTSYKNWWTDLHFKVRNKVRKVQKTGVELRSAELDDALSRGVKDIYDESPIRQGRRFPHYGKPLDVIRA